MVLVFMGPSGTEEKCLCMFVKARYNGRMHITSGGLRETNGWLGDRARMETYILPNTLLYRLHF